MSEPQRPAEKDVKDVKSVEGVGITQVASVNTFNNKSADGSPEGDIALTFAAELDDIGYEPSLEIVGRVRRKIDWILLPLISCTATLSFLDKVSNNYAKNVCLHLPAFLLEN